LDNLATTTYTFTPNVGQCATTATLTITVTTGTILTPITGSNSVCISSTLQLSNTTIGGYWSSSNPNVASIDQTGLISGLLAGQTTITYLLSGSCGYSLNKMITVNALPKPILEDQYLCINNTTGNVISAVTLNCGIPNANHDFIWSRDGLPFQSSENSISTQLTGIYQVTVTDLSTGCSSSASAVVGTSSKAIVEASVGFDFARNQTINVSVIGGSGDYEFQLNDGSFQDSTIFTGSFDGEYDINVRDKNGCDETTLSVFALNYPRFFTPNGDGYNDNWNIEGLSAQPKAQIHIFDRYGKLIKSMTPSESGWDGTYYGQTLPATDYWFTLAYINGKGEQKEFRAHFSLKR
jgi:gliding motility-associated-like protein